MCLNCGCGDLMDNHGDPLNMTISRLRLVASRNGITILRVAENILGTILGEITVSNPRGEKDTVTYKLHRVRDHGTGDTRPTVTTRRPFTHRTRSGERLAAERQDRPDSEVEDRTISLGKA